MSLRVTLVFYITLIISLISIYSEKLQAQKKSLRFQSYTMDAGLPQNLVDCILQDSRGFMWFGTWGGLCRFDGYNFKTYRQQTKDYSTISNNFIYALEEDENGNLWIGTNLGINIYRYKADSFQTQLLNIPAYHVLHEKITAITKDTNNTLWIGTLSGLTRLNIDAESNITKIHTYPFGNNNQSLLGSTINHLFMDSKHQLWVSTDNGISILKKGTDNFSHLQNKPGDENSLLFNIVKCVYEDTQGNIWIGTEFGLSKFLPGTGQITNYLHFADNPNSLAHSYIMSIVQDANGNIIVGTLGGISLLKKNKTDTFINYTYSPFSEYALNNNFVNCLYRDRDGNIWIGTERGGINRYNSAKTEFEYFESEVGNARSLSSNIINSIIEDEHNIWVGTAGGGLNRMMKNTGNFKFYNSDPTKNREVMNDFISVLYRDKFNNFWVGSWGSGLYKLINENTANERFINYRPQPSGKGLINDYISSITSDSQGNLWIGTYDGLNKFDIKTGEFENITKTIGPAITKIGCLLFDQANNLWVGTRQGLFKLSFGKNHEITDTKSFLKNTSNPKSLSDNYVTTLFQDSNNTLWIGTYGFGVNKLLAEQNGGEFECLTMVDGIPNNIIYRIVEDNSGELWFTTDYGLSVYHKKSGKFKNYYTADGLQNNQYYWNAAYKNSQGRLYFGGMNGINSFFPDSIYGKANHQQKCIITDFKIYNHSVKAGQKISGTLLLDQSIITTKKISIPYHIKEFSFEFSALDYEQPNSINYSYKLDGFDENWNVVGPNRRFAGYTNLKPGQYIFKVKASNSKGDFSEQSTQIEVQIIPPFWGTWWFRLLLAALTITLLVSYNRYRVYSLEHQKRKLEKQVSERTYEIENQKDKLRLQNDLIHKQRDKLFELNKKVKSINELKLKFFTNISHEFRTPVTLISGPVERILNDTATPPKIKNALSVVSRNTNRLLHLINQLMDFRKIEQGKELLLVSAINFNDFLSNIVLAFSTLAEQKNINLQVNTITISEDSWIDFQKIEIVLYNLLSNAFKYTPQGGKITFDTFWNSNNPDNLIMSITDTGIGIPEEGLNLIFHRFYRIESSTFTGDSYGTGIGLSLSKELIEIHKGTIEVKSTVGIGSTFKIDIPVKRNCFENDEISEKKYAPFSINKKVLWFTNELSQVAANNHSISPPASIAGRPTVLVVEDNADLREFISGQLNENYNIIEAKNGTEGLSMATNHNPDIIVSDIMMPEMNGLELCRHIKSNLLTSHIPLILLTAKNEIEDEIAGIGTGADNYLTKPFNFELLETYIAKLIESRKKLFETFRLQNETDVKILAKTPTDEIFLTAVVTQIEENIEQTEFNVSLLAEKLFISRGHLHRKLLALANLSPVDFINTIRLKKSKTLLQNLNMNISEVAYAVGYSDPKYFARQFRKQFNQSPSGYQEELRKRSVGR